MDEQPITKACKNCYWFMLSSAGRKCCYSASPLLCNYDEELVCAHWRDKRHKSERARAIEEIKAESYLQSEREERR